MQGVMAMLRSKAERHAAAAAKYQAVRQHAEQKHNSTAASVAADSKSRVDAIHAVIEADLMAVLAEDKVMVLNEQQLHEVSKTGMPLGFVYDPLLLPMPAVPHAGVAGTERPGVHSTAIQAHWLVGWPLYL